MATITIKKAEIEGPFNGYHGATIRWFPEAASQSFKKGDFVYLNSGKVTVCADGAAKILGMAQQDATGVTDTQIAVAVFDVATRLVMNKTTTKAGAVTAVTDVGVAAQMYAAKSATGNKWTADTNNYGTAVLYVVSLYQADTVGDTGGRLVVGVVPGALQTDNSASAATITDLTASVAELNTTDLSAVGAPNGIVYTKVVDVAIGTSAGQANHAAGASLVPAVTGKKFKLVDVKATAIGGALTATAAATGLGIYCDVGGTPVLLCNFLLAACTENTLVRMGDANTVVLAAGASFSDQVAAKAISAKAVSAGALDLATATSVRVVISYTLV